MNLDKVVVNNTQQGSCGSCPPIRTSKRGRVKYKDSGFTVRFTELFAWVRIG